MLAAEASVTRKLSHTSQRGLPSETARTPNASATSASTRDNVASSSIADVSSATETCALWFPKTTLQWSVENKRSA